VIRTTEPSIARALGRAVAVALVVPSILRRREDRRPRAAGGAREFESVSRVARELTRAADIDGVARTLLDELCAHFAVGFVALTFVSDDRREAAGYLARANGRDVDWWRDVRLDLEHEPSGIASAVFEASALTVYDAGTSGAVSRRLVDAVGAKSVAFVPLLVEERVIAVISVATDDEPRVFAKEDLALMQTLASEAAVALERVRSALALEEALARERLLGSIARALRSELDLSSALAAAAEETGRAVGAARCFVRIGEPDQLPEVAAEWHEPSLHAVEEEPAALELLGRAAEQKRPVAEELDSTTVVAVPILVFEQPAGFLSVHRPRTRPWSTGELALLEAIAGEIGLALRLARLLEKNEAHLAQQSALLRVAHALGSELDLDLVLQRLAEQLASLLEADAAGCYLLDRSTGVFRCVAVHGVPRSLVGFEFAAARGLAGATIREGRALIASAYGEISEPVSHPAYQGFSDAIAAPIVWRHDIRGVIGAGRRLGRHFVQRDARVLEAFAGLASLALGGSAEMVT
jgi:GAF domain-containing protein